MCGKAPDRNAMTQPPTAPSDEPGYAREWFERIVNTCPQRRSGSADEKQGQQLVEAEFARLGLQTEFEPFTFNGTIHGMMAAHFGLSLAGSALTRSAPAVALCCHLLAAGSYWAEAGHHASVLRRLLPRYDSQNLLASLPATEDREPTLRIVIPAHMDAGFTGLVFSPSFLSRTSGGRLEQLLPMADRPLALVTASQLGLAVVDLFHLVVGRRFPRLGLIEGLLNLPSLTGLALNSEVLLRNQVVPGTNDNLSGVIASLLLAQRLAADKPANVEIVFAITGAEEAGLCGADALARSGRFDPANTVVIALDGIANGELHYFLEGEIERAPTPGWLVDELRAIAAADPRFGSINEFAVPVGGTDVYPFRRHGFAGVSLGAVDPSRGAPEHYHQPTDTPERLDMERFLAAVDFSEQLIRRIMVRRELP